MDSGSKLFLDLLQEFRTFDPHLTWETLTDDQKNKLSLLGSFTQHGSPHATYLWLIELANKKILADELDKTAQIFQEEKLQGSNTLNESVVREFLPNSQDRSDTPPTNQKETVAQLVKRVQKAYSITQRVQAARANLLAHQAVSAKSTKPVRDIVADETDEADTSLKNKVDPRITSSQKFVEKYQQTTREIVDASFTGLDTALKYEIAYELSRLALNDSVDLSNSMEVAATLDLIATDKVPGHISILKDFYLKTQSIQETETPFTDAVDNLQGKTKTISPNQIPDLDQTQLDELNTRANSVEGIINQRLPDIQIANETRTLIQKRLAANLPPPSTSSDHQHLTPENLDRVARAAMADGLPIRSFPTQNGAKVSEILKKTDPNNGLVHATTAQLVSRVGSVDQLIAHAKANPNSQLGKMLKEEPQFFDQVNRQAQILKQSPLFKDINESFSKPLAAFQNATNWITSKLPEGISKPLNVVLHPVQALQSWVGKKIGEKIVKEIGRVVVEKIGSEAVKKVAQTLIAEGLKKGLTTLALEVGTALGLDLAAAATGVGLPVAAVMLIVQAAVAAAVFIGQAVLSNSKDWAETAVGGVVSVGAGAAGLVSGTAGLLGVATVATTSAASTIIISTVIVIFLYLTSFTIAPILSTLVHLESGLGPLGGASKDIGVSSGYTGPIIPGCPSTWPVSGGYVLQGPHGTYSHEYVEGIDIYVPDGSEIKSVSYGKVTTAGWGDVYGNWIIVDSSTTDGRNFSVIYAHLMEIGVSVGDSVAVGTTIALSDSTSSVPGFANPHLHLEYRGIPYNSCPAGGVQVPDTCASADSNQPFPCFINGAPIYTN